MQERDDDGQLGSCQADEAVQGEPQGVPALPHCSSRAAAARCSLLTNPDPSCDCCTKQATEKHRRDKINVSLGMLADLVPQVCSMLRTAVETFLRQWGRYACWQRSSQEALLTPSTLSLGFAVQEQDDQARQAHDPLADGRVHQGMPHCDNTARRVLFAKRQQASMLTVRLPPVCSRCGRAAP